MSLQIDDKVSQLLTSVKSKVSKKILCIYIYTDTNLALNYFSLTAKSLSDNIKEHKSRSYSFFETAKFLSVTVKKHKVSLLTDCEFFSQLRGVMGKSGLAASAPFLSLSRGKPPSPSPSGACYAGYLFVGNFFEGYGACYRSAGSYTQDPLYLILKLSHNVKIFGLFMRHEY